MDREHFEKIMAQLDDMPSATKAAKAVEGREGQVKFTCEYEHEGVMSTFTINATDMYDAAKRLSSLVNNATVRGRTNA